MREGLPTFPSGASRQAAGRALCAGRDERPAYRAPKPGLGWVGADRLARTTLRLPPNRACAFQRTRLSIPLDPRPESLAGSCSNRRWMISACISRTFPLIVSSTQNCRPSPDRSAVSVRSPVPYALGRPPHRRLSRPLRRAFEYYDGSVAMQVPLASLFRRSRSCAREESRCV
jgi:hypothetical protein